MKMVDATDISWYYITESKTTWLIFIALIFFFATRYIDSQYKFELGFILRNRVALSTFWTKFAKGNKSTSLSLSFPLSLSPPSILILLTILP